MARVFPEKSCGCIILQSISGTWFVLLVESASHHHWTFPKGHMEDAETEMETARREVQEETGLIISITDSFRHVMHYPTRRGNEKEVVYFLTFVEHPIVQIQPEEIAAFRWVPLENAEEFVTMERDKATLRHVITHLNDSNK